MGDGLGSGFSAIGLGGSESAEGDEHGRVNGPGIVEESADDFLETSEAGGIKGCGRVVRFGELGGLAIGRRCPGVWCVLGAMGWVMLELMEGLFNVARHGHVDSAGDVVPLECHAKEAFAGPLGGDVIERRESVNEVLGMFLPNILDSKVVDDEAEGDGTGGMSEEAGSVFGGTVTVSGKVFDEAVVGEDAGLR